MWNGRLSTGSHTKWNLHVHRQSTSKYQQNKLAAAFMTFEFVGFLKAPGSWKQGEGLALIQQGPLYVMFLINQLEKKIIAPNFGCIVHPTPRIHTFQIANYFLYNLISTQQLYPEGSPEWLTQNTIKWGFTPLE